jgi:hypothetical protein
MMIPVVLVITLLILGRYQPAPHQSRSWYSP